MSTNGNITFRTDINQEITPEFQLEYLDRQLRKLEIKKRGLEESRRELINRHNLNKAINETN